MAGERRGIGCGARLLLLGIGLAAGTVAAWLLLPEQAVIWVLAQFYPPTGYDLTDPLLLETWRWMLAGACGLAVCLILALLLALVRAARRKARAARPPEPIRELQKAIKAGDEAAVELVCRKIGQTMGDEAVPDLLDLLESHPPEPVRRKLAATLYQLGRVVTAEVQLHPTR